MDNSYETGVQKLKSQKYQQAIEAFNKSLALQEDWQSYQGLGFALGNTQQYQKAIEAFNKSLALQEDWQSYKGLGWVLDNLEQHGKAYECIINAFKLTMNIDEGVTWESAEKYEHIYSHLQNAGQFEKATRARHIYYRQSSALPHKMIDPLLGEKSGIPVKRELIESIKEELSRFQINFHPSYYSESIKDDQLRSWKHLLHIHIPKCAGTNFIEPLVTMIKRIESINKKEPRWSSQAYKHYLWHGNLEGKCMHDAYLSEAFRGKELNDLHGSFLSTHGAKYRIYDQHLQAAGISAKKICLVRDPSQRLYSHIRHHGCEGRDKSAFLRKYIKDFFNCMDRYIYDYNLYNDNEPPHCAPSDYEKCRSIGFFDISDGIAISKVKSAFLSATMLPNLVQYDRLNDHTEKEGFKRVLSENDFQVIHEELISQGFLERDLQIDLEFLKEKTKQKMVFPEIIDKSCILHPITFMLNKSRGVKLISTKRFIADPLSAINF